MAPSFVARPAITPCGAARDIERLAVNEGTFIAAEFTDQILLLRECGLADTYDQTGEAYPGGQCRVFVQGHFTLSCFVLSIRCRIRDGILHAKLGRIRFP